MAAVGIELVVVVLLVIFNGVLAGSELSLVSARRFRLEHRASAGDAGAAAALRLAGEPNRFLSTVQIGITLVGIFAGAFGGATLGVKLGASLGDVGIDEGLADALGVALVVLAISYLSLILGELVPKRLALQYPEAIAARVARPMSVLATIATPAVKVLGASTNVVLRLLPTRPAEESALSEDELRLTLRQSAEAGIIDAIEHRITNAVLGLGDRTIADLMTPRPDVVWLDIDASLEEVRSQVADSVHSLFPVCDGELDEVIGVVAVRDLFRAPPDPAQFSLTDFALPALYIPEQSSVISALEQFKAVHAQMAVVLDEYGGTAGVVTLTDILEALVGHVPVADSGEPLVVQRPDGSYLLDGRLSVEVLKSTLGIAALPQGAAYQTLAGLVLHLAGAIPTVGTVVEWEEMRFEVVDMDGRRVDRVLASPVRAGGGLPAC